MQAQNGRSDTGEVGSRRGQFAQITMHLHGPQVGGHAGAAQAPGSAAAQGREVAMAALLAESNQARATAAVASIAQGRAVALVGQAGQTRALRQLREQASPQQFPKIEFSARIDRLPALRAWAVEGVAVPGCQSLAHAQPP